MQTQRSVLRLIALAALVSSAFTAACDDGGSDGPVEDTAGLEDTVAPDAPDTPRPTGDDLVVIGDDIVETETADTADLVDPVTLYEPLYAPDRVLEIDIRVSSADWDLLRFQERDVLDVLGEGCLDGRRTHPTRGSGPR